MNVSTCGSVLPRNRPAQSFFGAGYFLGLTRVAPSSLPFSRVPARRPDGQPQRVQSDEAFRIFLPVDVILLEGGHVQAVEGPRRAPPGSTTRTLIELDAGGARDVLLRVIHGGLDHLPLRRVPVPVVHHRRITGNQVVP